MKAERPKTKMAPWTLPKFRLAMRKPKVEGKGVKVKAPKADVKMKGPQFGWSMPKMGLGRGKVKAGASLEGKEKKPRASMKLREPKMKKVKGEVAVKAPKAKKERASFNFGGSLKAKPKAEVAAPAVVMTAPELSASAPAVKVKAPKEPKVRAPQEKKEWKFDWKWGLGDVKLGGRWKTKKPKVELGCQVSV